MEPDAFVAHLKVDAPAILAAGRRSPAAPIPSCPEWTAETLVGHVGGALWWVEAMVRERATDVGAFADKPETWDALCAWYEEGLSALVTTLGEVGPDEPVWNWSVMGPGPARFWHRRVAHEAAIHRWDIEHAFGVEHVIDAALAADGIEEYLGIVPVWLALYPHPELSGSLGLVASDTAVAYTLLLAPDGVEVKPGLAGPDAVVRADASDLLLWLVGRRRPVTVEGDASIARGWSAVRFG